MVYNFQKMHGLGNDFVIIDLSEEDLSEMSNGDINPNIVKKIACRNRGIGFDQLILIKKIDKINLQTIIYNADGSLAKACGNAYRGVISYLGKKYDKNKVKFHSNGRLIEGEIIKKNSNNTTNNITKEVSLVEVSLGEATNREDLELSSKYNILSDENNCFNKNIKPVIVNVGNSHLVVFLNRIDEETILKYGPIFSDYFSKSLNVSFAHIESVDTINLRILERGAGWTLCCGSGACAALSAAHFRGFCKNKVKVIMPGGSLDVKIDPNNYNIKIIGEVNLAFTGFFDLKNYTQQMRVIKN